MFDWCYPQQILDEGWRKKIYKSTRADKRPHQFLKCCRKRGPNVFVPSENVNTHFRHLNSLRINCAADFDLIDRRPSKTAFKCFLGWKIKKKTTTTKCAFGKTDSLKGRMNLVKKKRGSSCRRGVIYTRDRTALRSRTTLKITF